jgi:hypothetical protein
MRPSWLLASALLAASLPAGAAAQQKGMEGLANRLKVRPAAQWSRGMRAVGEPTTGTLVPESSARVQVTLTAGRAYGLVGLCEQPCHDLDLRLFDPDGVEVNADVAPDAQPVVLVVPRRTGTYQVRAYMADCRAAECAFGVQLFVR